jgi:multisubunit Na+/H+ antiporter MnhB subunit
MNRFRLAFVVLVAVWLAADWLLTGLAVTSLTCALIGFLPVFAMNYFVPLGSEGTKDYFADFMGTCVLAGGAVLLCLAVCVFLYLKKE